MSRVLIACPYPLDSGMGNVVSAERIAGLLRELGHEAHLSHGWVSGHCDILLVLNAVKGAESVRSYREEHPEGALVVMLTGTDLYRDLPAGSEGGARSLALADRIVVMTEPARDRVPPEFRPKTFVIPKSLEIPEIFADRDHSVFGLAVVGHLREVKNPFQLVRVVATRPDWSEARVWQVGSALSSEMEDTAREWEAREPRYRWFGGLPRREGLARMKQSALTVNTSWLEGAPSAILESMTLGVPVLATAVEGNVGLLGTGYEGLFAPGDDEALLRLLSRGRDESGFLPSLTAACVERASLFSRPAEQEGWRQALAGL